MLFEGGGHIEEAPQRHVRIVCTLVFEDIHVPINQKRQVIFHTHIDEIFHGVPIRVSRMSNASHGRAASGFARQGIDF